MRSTTHHFFIGMISFTICFISPEVVRAGDLYAILVADTDAAGIGEDAKESVRWIQDGLKGNVPQDNLKLIKLVGKDATKQKIYDTIDLIPKDQGHCIFFYYVGHGYYEDGSLLAPIHEGNTYIPLSNIIARLKKRRPHSIVSMNDSCSVQPDGHRFYAAPVMPPPPKNSPLANKLFFDHNDWIHLNSSAPGEYAISHQADLRDGKENIYTGSPFAIAFYGSLRNAFQPRSWNEVASEISKEVRDNYKKTAPGGRLRLNGKTVIQHSQTVRAMRNGELFLGGEDE